MKQRSFTKAFLIYITIFCYVNSTAIAQGVQLQYKYFTIEDGLPNRTVNCITQDSIGFIWLATDKGICKFNGYTFETYTQKNGLKFNEVRAIHCVSNEIIWIEYNNFDEDRVDVFNTKTLKTFSFNDYYINKLPASLLKKMNRVVKGINQTFYIGLHDTTGFITYNSLNQFIYNNNSYATLLLKADEQNNIYGYAKETNSIIKVNTILNKAEVTSIFQPTLNLLTNLFFIYSKDYFAFSESISNTFLKSNNCLAKKLKSLTTNYCCSFINDKKYFQNDYKIYNTISGDELLDFSQINKNILSVSNPIKAKYVDASGTIWLGLEFGLLQISILPKKFSTILDNIAKDGRTMAIRGIIENGNKQIYINTENSLQLSLSNSNNSSYKVNNKITTNELLFSFCKDDLGNIYYHNSKYSFNCIYKIDKNNVTTALAKVNFNDRVWSMSCINTNDMWLGTEKNGVFIVDLKNQSTRPIEYNRFKELSTALIYQINKVDDNTIWICSDKGLYKASTTTGIVERYCNEGKSKYYLPTNNIAFMQVDKENNIWLATLDKGLVLYNIKNGYVKTFGKAEGLPTETIYATYEDNNENLWMPSDNGIIQFNKKQQEVARIYTTKDGISHSEFNRIAHYRSTDSTLFFGSLNGVTYFNPKNFYNTSNSLKPNLAVEQAKVFNGNSGKFLDIENDVKSYKEIELNASDRFISVQLALLTFTNVDGIQYAYKVDDNGDWIFQNSRTIQIAGLSWGKHLITIKAKNENGIWSNNTITIHLNQLKPFYLQTWFLILFLILIGLGIFMYNKIKTKKFKQQQIILKQLVDERTHELIKNKNELDILLQQREVLLKEIHHRVKNNLAVISGLLELQSDNTQDELAKSTLLEGTNRVRSIALIHQKLYQNENFASIELHEFINDLYKQIASVMTTNTTAIKVNNNVKKVLIDIDTSIPLGLIINELVTNSFKYAFVNNSQPLLNIHLQAVDDETYQLTYADNGKGLPPDFDITKAKSLGIRLIHKLAKQLSGSIGYERTNELTTFTITFKTLEARNKE
ncbi:MAG: sensor histidine kinase [Chitinophagaceae bacterium]